MLHIVTDGMSDYLHVPQRDPGVIVIPQPLRFGMEEYLDDGVSITQEAFYARLRTATELPKTSMVPVNDWREAIEPLLENPADEVLVIAGSSKLSGGYQSACMAAAKVRDVHRVAVLDSLSVSAGETLLVDQAVRLRNAGATLTEALAALEALKARQRVVGLAEDLKYLVMGGRLNPLAGKVGSALSIKPTLALVDGVIVKEGMVRGVKKGYAWYIDQLRLQPPAANSTVYIGGADCPETTQMLRDMIGQAGIPNEVRCVPIGCLIGTHAGPGLTLICWTKA